MNRRQDLSRQIGSAGLAMALFPGMALACALPPSVMLTLLTASGVVFVGLVLAALTFDGLSGFCPPPEPDEKTGHFRGHRPF